MQFLVQQNHHSFTLHTSIANKTMTNSLVQPLLFERRRNAKTGLNEGNSEKSALAVTENVHLTEEADAIATVEDAVKSEPIGFVLHVETTILHSEQNAIVVGNQSKETWQNVAAHSETIVEEEVVMIEEVVVIEEVVIKSSIIEMIGSALHVRMTTFLSEQNAINAANLDQEDNPVAEIEEAATETTVAEIEEAEDAMVIVEDVEETETVVEEMTVLENNIEKLVESDQVMLITDHQKKSNHADISDVITMIIKVKS